MNSRSLQLHSRLANATSVVTCTSIAGAIACNRSRREDKIGEAFKRRESEISLQLPGEIKSIHYIKTDDSSGVESIGTTGSPTIAKKVNDSRSLQVMFWPLQWLLQ